MYKFVEDPLLTKIISTHRDNSKYRNTHNFAPEWASGKAMGKKEKNFGILLSAIFCISGHKKIWPSENQSETTLISTQIHILRDATRSQKLHWSQEQHTVSWERWPLGPLCARAYCSSNLAASCPSAAPRRRPWDPSIAKPHKSPRPKYFEGQLRRKSVVDRCHSRHMYTTSPWIFA